MSKGCSKCGTDNADDARLCRHCGVALTAPAAAAAPSIRPFKPVPMPAPSPPRGLWIGLGALVAVLGAGGGVWWLTQERAGFAPTFDSAPPPSVLGASAPESTPTAPVAPDTPAAATSGRDLWEPAADATVITEPSDRQLQAAREGVQDKAARDAKAKALREQRAKAASQAQADPAQRRADGARARAAQPVPDAAPLPRPPSPDAPPAAVRSVQDRCANLNVFAKGICEARECVRAEHAGESVCQRIKAADDRRRDP